MKRNIKEAIIKNLNKDNLRFGESMTKHTTFGIGGPADVFYIAKTANDLVKAVKLSRQLKISYFVFGGGSNILVADRGIKGLVVKMENGKWKMENGKIFAEAGCSLAKLINTTTENSLTGLEMLAGIPGTVGGAIVGNAGTKYGSISQVIEKVTVLGKDDKIYQLDNKGCQFDYRSSRFKKSGEVVLSAILKLKREKKEEIKQKIRQVLKNRENQPKGKSAGSIFKNPRSANAGYLIENAGFKGKKIGGAKVSERHANYIINTGNSSCSDVLKLISLIKNKVLRDFKVRLEEEVIIVRTF